MPDEIKLSKRTLAEMEEGRRALARRAAVAPPVAPPVETPVEPPVEPPVRTPTKGRK